MREATAQLVAYADSFLAHDDKNPPTLNVTFDDLDRAIDVIEDLSRRYILLLTGASFPSLTPIDTTNAVNVFRFPWIDPDHPPTFLATI